jgi:flagellar export protein FliJ
VLDYRTNVVDRLRLELAVSESQVHRERVALAALQADEQLLIARQCAHQDNGCTIDDMVHVSGQFDLLRVRVRQQEVLLQRAEAEAEEVRSRLEEASKGMKTLERLRERHTEEWRQEERRLERIESAEIAARHGARVRSLS